MRFLKFFGGYFRPYLGWALLAAFSIPMYGVASTALVAMIEPIFGDVLLADSSRPAMMSMPDVDEDTERGSPKFNLKEWSIRGYQGLKRDLGITDANVVYFVPAILVLIFVLRATGSFLSGYSFQHIGLGITNDVRNDLYRRLLDQSSKFHGAHPSGELVSRVISDVNMIQFAVANNLMDFLMQGITLVFLLALLLSTNLKLALICLIGAPMLLYPIVRFGKSMRKSSHRTQERLAEVTDLLTEGIRGHRVVKAFGMEEFEEARFRVATFKHLRMRLRVQVLSSLSSPVIETISIIGSAALLVYAGLEIRSGALTAPALVQFIANLMLMYDPIKKLNKVNLVLQNALAGAHRVMDLMELPIDVEDRPGATEIDGIRDSVGFDEVRFGYGDRGVLNGVDLRIPRGALVALVGPSGAGKTTLVNLLPRFFDPDAGAVRIDGVDVRDVTLASLRAQIGLVTQETVLFNDTIRNNIAYGREDLSLDFVRQAARAAYADDFILEQPKGYDTVIGESGSHLSGGQRQRLSIARAILKDAPILILDEATSHLDTESEALVQKALDNLTRDRTTLVVAHRLSTVMRADRIVVLEEGRVVEDGTHDELLSRDGLYRKLYDLQFEM